MLGSEILPLLAAELHLRPEFPGKVLKFLTSLDVKFLSDTSYMWVKNIYSRDLTHSRCYISDNDY